MAQPYEPKIPVDGELYFPPPYSDPELPPSLRNGLIPMGILAILSTFSTILLIGFIIYRFISWRLHYRTFVGYNQYVVLVLNLLIADNMQSGSFLISWHWYRRGHILAPSTACFAQGWLLQSGDVSNAFFVLAIAVHSYYTAVYGRRVGYKTFVAIIVWIWVSVYFFTAIGLAAHPEETYFVAAGAWCWISSAYEIDRLWCHYIWVFMVQFGTIFIYLLIFYRLRKRTRDLTIHGQLSPQSPNATTLKAINRVALLMTLYPCVYVLLTLPLSAGRMWSMSHGGKNTSDAFSCIAGSLMTSCGWVDTLLYTLTRKRLLEDTMPHSARRSTPHDEQWHELNNEDPATAQMRGNVVNFDMIEPANHARSFSRPFMRDRTLSQTSSIDPILARQSSARCPNRVASINGTWKISSAEEKQGEEYDTASTWSVSTPGKFTDTSR